MIVLRALAWLHGFVQGVAEGVGQGLARRDGTPTIGCAWTGPWPPGALPVTVAYGDGSPIFVGYLDAANPATRQRDLAAFWRGVADTFDAEEADR